MNLQCVVQSCPDGLVQASIVGGWFAGNDSSTLVAGVYIIHCRGLPLLRPGADAPTSGATVFAYKVQDLERYGGVAFDQQRNVSFPKSNYVVSSLYSYNIQVVDIVKALEPRPVRAGNSCREPVLSRSESTHRADHVVRLRLARNSHASRPARGWPVYRHLGARAGLEDRLPRTNSLARWLHQRRTVPKVGRALVEDGYCQYPLRGGRGQS